MRALSDLIDTTEMYLKTVFELEEEGIPALRARIVERLGQSGPTVSETVARLERDRLLAVLGASSALGDHLARHPRHWVTAAFEGPIPGPERAARLVAAVGPEARGNYTAQDALRIAYREQLLGIAALDPDGLPL